MKRVFLCCICLLGLDLSAVMSPLGSWKDYIFAPLNPSNGASIVQGSVMGRGGGYRQVRVEDLAFLNEAVSERMAVMSGYWYPQNAPSNYVKALNWNNPPISSFYQLAASSDSARYLDSQEGLLTGIEVVDLTPITTNITEHTHSVTDGWETVTITNGWTSRPNPYRPDWPNIVEPVVVSHEQMKYKEEKYETTNTYGTSWMDCTKAGTNVFQMGIVARGQPGTKLTLPLPTFDNVTNLFDIIGKTDYLIFKDDLEGLQMAVGTETKIYSYITYTAAYSDSEVPSAPSFEPYEDNVTSEVTAKPHTNSSVVGGTVYRLTGDANRWIRLAYDRDGYIFEGFQPYWASSPECKWASATETYAESFVVSNRLPHTTALLTTGGVRRLSAACTVFQTFRLHIYEASRHEVHTGGWDTEYQDDFPRVSTNYDVMARLDGQLIIYSETDTNAVVVTTIKPKEIFSGVSGVTKRWTSLGDFDDGKGLVAPSVFSIDQDWVNWEGFPMKAPYMDSLSSDMDGTYELTLNPTQIILFKCDFRTDLD